MAATMENWVHEKGVVTERDRIALEKAKRMEKKYEKECYRWYKINERTKILVPFKKDLSEPTDEGWMKIAKLKETLGIK
jgi:hypothetical protein